MKASNVQMISAVIERLVAETHMAFASCGSEQPVEITRKIVLDALAEVWPLYLAHQLCTALGMKSLEDGEGE